MQTSMNEMTEENLHSSNKLKNIFHVNTTLLPLKLLFFVHIGALAGVLPFMPIIGKQLGFNVEAVGIAFALVPIFTLLTNPIVGFLVDYFQNIKAFLIAFVVLSCVAHLSVLGITPINPSNEDIAYVQEYPKNISEQLMNISTPFNRTCLDKILKKEIQCELRSGHANITAFSNTHYSTSNSINITYNSQPDATNSSEHDEKYWITFLSDEFSLPEINELQCSPSIQQCSFSIDTAFVFTTYQYWIYFTLVVIGGITTWSCSPLLSVACLEIIGSRQELYGRQRVFGTLSYGLICSLTGILNDKIGSTEKSFLSGFYLMAVLTSINVIVLCVMQMPKPNLSNAMCQDLGKILSSKEIIVFALGVTLIGFFSTIISTYEFWFLEDLGASQTLLGLAMAVQCLLGEAPFLFCSSWFVNKFGHFLCLTISFAGFAFRFILYWILKDPWLVLPIDILNGVTYGIYHGAMASFSKIKAPKGMEATLQGLFAGLYDGLGQFLGSIVGGYGIGLLGARWTFFALSLFSLGWLLVFLVTSYVYRSPKESEISPEVHMEEIVPNK